MAEKQIYREKTLERVNSPEDLNSYIRVVNPGTWIILSAAILLLIGALIWCATIELETKTVTAAAIVKNEELSLYVTEEGKADIREGMTFKIDGKEYVLPTLEMQAVRLYARNDSSIMKILGTEDENEFVYRTKFGVDLPNGVYTATITASEVSPMELILN